MFCECSANQLRQLRRTYCNFTESDGSEDSELCYFMPKLEKLLSVFREFANSQHEGKEYSADCFIYETYLFISFMETKTEDKQSGYFCISYHKLTLSYLRSLQTFLKISTLRLCVKFQDIHCPLFLSS